jgi:nitroreductase
MQTALTALDVIFSRRSVRAYTPQPLEDETVHSLLDAAIQAPTAIHAEPWAFVIVQDADALKQVSDRTKADLLASAATHQEAHARGEATDGFLKRVMDPAFSVFYDAHTLIVICAAARQPFAAADCWLAAENLMLAATALGLGTCVIGSAVGALNTDDIKRALGIPPSIEAIAPIVVGVPASSAATPALRGEPRIVNWLKAADRRHNA